MGSARIKEKRAESPSLQPPRGEIAELQQHIAQLPAG